MKIRNRTFKIITLLTLSILMLAIMAVFPLVKNASAAENNLNYFDMTVFETDNLQSKTEHVKVLGVNEYNFAYSFVSAQTDAVEIKSGYFYLPAGQYTLSAIYQTTYESDTVDCWLVQKDETETLCALSWEDGVQNVLRSNTFTAPINGFYYLRVYHGASNIVSDTYLTSFSEVMINEGAEALPFVPYIQTNDEINAINQGSDNIIAKLDELFGAESGIIAGASLGTVILLIAILLFITKRR